MLITYQLEMLLRPRLPEIYRLPTTDGATERSVLTALSLIEPDLP